MQQFLVTITPYFNAAWNIIAPFSAMIVIYGIYAVIAWMKKKGYQTTYLSALARAVGEANNAAIAAGTTLNTPAGLAIGRVAGAAYLMSTVGPEAAALGITTVADHGTRVQAAIGAALMPVAAPVVSAMTSGNISQIAGAAATATLAALQPGGAVAGLVDTAGAALTSKVAAEQATAV
jgi:hypothetical protein